MDNTCLDKTANLVFSKLDKAIAKDNWGASFKITFLVASGVTSLAAKPVPPVVKTMFKLSTSEKYCKAD